MDIAHPLVRQARRVQAALDIPSQLYPTTFALTSLLERNIPALVLGLTTGKRQGALAEMEDSLDEIYDELEAYDELFGDAEDDEDDDEDEEIDDDFFEIVCPGCGETIYFDDDMLDRPDGLICPNCNEPIDIELKMGDCDDEEE